MRGVEAVLIDSRIGLFSGEESTLPPKEMAKVRAITDPRPDADNQGEGGTYPVNKASLTYSSFVALRTNLNRHCQGCRFR